MNLAQNISEGINSIKANILRTILTGLIIAIGITSLVGMLTAVDGIRSEIVLAFPTLEPTVLLKFPIFWQKKYEWEKGEIF